MVMRRRQLLIASAAAAASATLAGCGGGGSDAAAEPSITVRSFGSGGSSTVAAGKTVRADNVVTAGKLREQSVVVPGGAHRLFYDDAGRAQAVRLADGSSFRFEYPRTGRVDVVATNAGGVRLWGLSLYEEGGQLRAAPMGTALADQQINASLTGAVQGSLTVSADPQDTMPGVDRLKSQAFSANLIDALMTGISTASASPPGTAQALAASSTQIGRGLLQSGVLGVTLAAAGYYLPAILAGTAAAGALATVGSALLLGAGGYYIATGLLDFVGGSAKALSEDQFDEARDSGATDRSLLDRLQRGLDSMQSSGRAFASRVLDIGRSAASSSEPVPAAVGQASLPALSGVLPAVASAVRGVLVDTAGRLFTGGGTLASGGQLSLELTNSSGARATVSGSRSGSSFTGSYNVAGSTGSFSGTQAAVGQCNASSSSGGSGAFSYSYNVGRTQGSFPFRYDMYSVPDQARIIDLNGRELFNTGGLVSGSRSVSVPLQGSANVVVLVNAPTSGTGWEFTIGCAS